MSASEPHAKNMKCPTPHCTESLPTHSRKLYCYKCRASMAYHARKRPAQILATTERYERGLYRVGHLEQRRMDQIEAITQARKKPNGKYKPVRSHRERTQL